VIDELRSEVSGHRTVLVDTHAEALAQMAERAPKP
jgi:hypothetical protein